VRRGRGRRREKGSCRGRHGLEVELAANLG
jgi:hypothetical protein